MHGSLPVASLSRRIEGSVHCTDYGVHLVNFNVYQHNLVVSEARVALYSVPVLRNKRLFDASKDVATLQAMQKLQIRVKLMLIEPIHLFVVCQELTSD